MPKNGIKPPKDQLISIEAALTDNRFVGRGQITWLVEEVKRLRKAITDE